MDKAGRADLRRELGRRGEEWAAEWLASQGCRILDCNWRCPGGELDIVAEDGETVVFVEVRSRRNTGTFGTPEQSVDARKQRRVREVARYYLYKHKWLERKIRFDVIAVTFSRSGELLEWNHIRQAF